MENIRKQTLDSNTNKIETDLVNYLVDNTLDMVIDVLADKDANYIEAHEHLYKRYLCINAFVENGENQETLATLLVIYKTILLSDLFKDRNKLVLLNLVLSIAGKVDKDSLGKIEYYIKIVENDTDKGNLELINKIKEKLNIINLNSRIIKLYNLNNFEAIYSICENMPFEYFDLTYKSIKHNGLYETLDSKQKERLDGVYIDRLPY